MAVFTYLGQSGETRYVRVSPWEHGIRKGHWGRYGAWVSFNLNPMDLSTIISDEKAYAGDGFDYHWRIRWS